MPKISRTASALISQILCILAFAVLTVLAVLLPALLKTMMQMFGKPDYLYIPTLIIAYISAVPAFAADAALFLLLRCVKLGQVFTSRSVALIRLISWLCFIEAVIFFSLGFYYIIGFIAAFVFVFMGLIVRVVKNVIEEAVYIKEENDYTI